MATARYVCVEKKMMNANARCCCLDIYIETG